MNTEQLEKEIKDFVNAIFIRGEKDAIEYASSFIQTKQREAFEALDLAQADIRSCYARLGFKGSNVLDLIDKVLSSRIVDDAEK